MPSEHPSTVPVHRHTISTGHQPGRAGRRDYQLWLAVALVLLVLLALWLVFQARTLNERQALTEQELERLGMDSAQRAGDWLCMDQECLSTVDVEAWRREHCTPVQGDGGQSASTDEGVLCTFIIDGAQQTVPLADINLTYLSEQCVSYLCHQAIFVRREYRVDSNASSIQTR